MPGQRNSKYSMRYYEILSEKVGLPVLYHNMDGRKALGVFQNGIMPPRWEHVVEGGKKLKGNSFSRNRHYAHGQSIVQITVDRDKLGQTNRIIVLDGEVTFRLEQGKSLSDLAGFADRRINRDAHVLAEEFVFGTIDLRRVVTGVFLRRGSEISRDQHAVREAVTAWCSKYSMPLRFTKAAEDAEQEWVETQRAYDEDD